ncbi:hypothetical protein AERO8C_20319 [Aeromonas veronii]|uniref:Uncharacterized protein n=1 Tax=Aeromonas veronii TaxID=654 RepID=A0A653L0M0_AERVE|nr:hypothetical protein AERO8C_20319 [Aeromonas veronii]
MRQLTLSSPSRLSPTHRPQAGVLLWAAELAERGAESGGSLAVGNRITRR